jgi:hypothetical protein
MMAEQAVAIDPARAARDLAPRVRERAREIERLGTLPPDLVDTLRSAGLFGLVTPRTLGGSELAAATMIGNSTAFLAWLNPLVAAELIGRGTTPIGSSVTAPTGRLTPSGCGYRLDGRWAFSSGCLHADWFINGALTADEEGPRNWRLAVFPAGDASVLDNWDVVGLVGTGSHDVTAQAVHVPREHVMAPLFEPARLTGRSGASRSSPSPAASWSASRWGSAAAHSMNSPSSRRPRSAHPSLTRLPRTVMSRSRSPEPRVDCGRPGRSSSMPSARCGTPLARATCRRSSSARISCWPRRKPCGRRSRRPMRRVPSSAPPPFRRIIRCSGAIAIFEPPRPTFTSHRPRPSATPRFGWGSTSPRSCSDPLRLCAWQRSGVWSRRDLSRCGRRLSRI